MAIMSPQQQRSENTQTFDHLGKLTFALQSRVRGKERKGSLLHYKTYIREKEPPLLYMRVNHKTIMAASPVFKTMLKYTFLEGATLRRTGRVEVPLPEDDPVPFAILMDIIHGRERWPRVPRQVDLLFLTRLAILVDKYELLAAVAPFVKEWFEGLRSEIPQSFNGDVVHWLCVAWVFRREVEFNHVTRLAERESNGLDLDSYSRELKEDLPIPQRVLEEISRHRLSAISRCFDILSRNISLLQSGSPRCTSTRHEPHRFTCDAVLLGSLLESSSKLGVWPPPEEPYEEMTFKGLVEGVEGLRLMSFCTQQGFANKGASSHGMKTEICGALGKCRTRLQGLNMRDFERVNRFEGVGGGEGCWRGGFVASC